MPVSALLVRRIAAWALSALKVFLIASSCAGG